MAIMYDAFPARDRGLAMGLFMTGWSLGPFFGSLVGGYLTEHVHWRAIFYINIPVGLLSVVAAVFLLPRHNTDKEKIPLDWLGFASMTAAVTALLVAQPGTRGGLEQPLHRLSLWRSGSVVLPLHIRRAESEKSFRGVALFSQPYF